MNRMGRLPTFGLTCNMRSNVALRISAVEEDGETLARAGSPARRDEGGSKEKVLTTPRIGRISSTMIRARQSGSRACLVFRNGVAARHTSPEGVIGRTAQMEVVDSLITLGLPCTAAAPAGCQHDALRVRRQSGCALSADVPPARLSCSTSPIIRGVTATIKSPIWKVIGGRLRSVSEDTALDVCAHD